MLKVNCIIDSLYDDVRNKIKEKNTVLWYLVMRYIAQ